MPRVNLGRPNYEKMFGDALRGAVYGTGKECREVAAAVGRTGRTLSSRFKEPGQMPLVELKAYIKVTGLRPEEVFKYLYEKEMEVKK